MSSAKCRPFCLGLNVLSVNATHLKIGGMEIAWYLIELQRLDYTCQCGSGNNNKLLPDSLF